MSDETRDPTAAAVAPPTADTVGAVVAPPRPVAVPDPLPDPVPAPVATFDALLADEVDEAASADGLSILNALGSPTAVAASAAESYGYDKKLADEGKWFKWPKLGPAARVRLCKVGCKGWKIVSDRARERYGSDDGSIKPAVMDKIIEPMMAKAIFVGMEGVIVSVVDGVPGAPLVDTEENRLLLLEMFTPDLRNDLFKVAAAPKNFRDLTEEILGN